MSGGRILLVLLAVGAGVLWWGLYGGRGQDLVRGVEETDLAFRNVAAALDEAGPDLEFLLGLPGLRLAVQEEYDRLVGDLAALRDERVDIEHDASLGERERLPALRDLVERTDGVLARAEAFRRRLSGRVTFMRDSTPLLTRAEELHTGLADLDVPDDVTATRISQLAGTWAELRNRTKLADRLIDDNPTQGVAMGSGILSELRSLIDEQAALLAAHTPP